MNNRLKNIDHSTTETISDSFHQKLNQLKKWNENYTSVGIWYDDPLANMNGIYAILYVESYHTKEDIQKAKKEIINKRDVVKFKILKEGRN